MVVSASCIVLVMADVPLIQSKTPSKMPRQRGTSPATTRFREIRHRGMTSNLIHCQPRGTRRDNDLADPPQPDREPPAQLLKPGSASPAERRFALARW